jgi:hypothetical protein
VMMYFLPIDGMPVHQLARGRTRRDERCHLPCLLSRLIKLSRHERPDGSQPAGAWDDIAVRRNPYPFHYRTAFAFSIIPYPTPHRLTLRLAVPQRENVGLTTFRRFVIPRGVRFCLSAGGVVICVT